ncbi:MAG: peroxidase family protein [Ilumatobacteraceae bacterium]
MTNEFATVGYRAHSQIHGEFEASGDRVDYTEATLDALEASGVEVTVDGDEVEFAVPLAIAFGNPELLEMIGLDAVASGLASERAYRNDEEIDNQLRSVLFQIPSPDVDDPMSCLDGTALSGCYSVVNDLGALDVVRGYDHGMPSYNDLREAYGLPRVPSFAELTGDPTQAFPTDPQLDAASPGDDPDSLDVVALFDASGRPVELGSDAATTDPIVAVRRTSLAARLSTVFESVDDVDAFTGMVSEPHVSGTEFGELQLAMWTRQFAALRDGDRFFFGNDPVLDELKDRYGLDFRRSLGQVIADNTDVVESSLPASVFVLDPDPGAAAPNGGSAAGSADASPADAGAGAGPGAGADPSRPRPDDRRQQPGEPPRGDRPRPDHRSDRPRHPRP